MAKGNLLITAKNNLYITNSTRDIKILLPETCEKCQKFLKNDLSGRHSIP